MRLTLHSRAAVMGLIVPFALVAATALAEQPGRGTPRSKPTHNDACKDPSDDPAGCQPSTFDTPIGQIPGGRVDRNGNLNPTSSARDAKEGAFLVEKRLGLFRNFKHLHWLPTVPSVRDPGTGEWRGGDLDGFPTSWGSRALGIAGDCLFLGHSNSTNTTGPGVFHDIKIFKIQPDPERNPPVEVGSMPQLRAGPGGQTAVRDRETRAYLYTSTDGRDRMLMVRNAATGTAGQVITYTVDADTCLPVDEGRVAAGVAAHEFYLWHDPNNPNRFLVASQTYGGTPQDLIITAITDENTGEVLEEPQFLASFTLQDQGGPLRNANPAQAGLTAGLHVDGRFTDYRHLRDSWGRAGASQGSQGNLLHSGSLSDDGERFYAAGGTAGFYVLNTAAIANHSNADLAAGRVCNQQSTNVWVNGVIGGQIDVSRLPLLADDCIHTVLVDDPGVQALLASGASDEVKRLRYSLLEQRARFDFNPPFVASVGVHSAVAVPNRPSLSGATNPKRRPAYVLLTEETPFGPCPERSMRIVTVESEITPMIVGTFAMPDSLVENCITQSASEPDGTMKAHRPMMHAHNPTVFRNIAFVNWQGHGLRAVDISNPFTPREVGHARTVPWGDIMTYPDFKDGLIYVGDNHTGLHVLKYTGPRADELPDGVYSSNRTSPHR